MESIKDKKILVVDDHKELLKMIDEILRKEGFSRVFLASSYEEAVKDFRCCIARWRWFFYYEKN